MEKETIRNFSGQIIAYYEHQPNGDIVVRDFYGRILGKYDKQFDVTREFSGIIIAKGNAIGMLIR